MFTIEGSRMHRPFRPARVSRRFAMALAVAGLALASLAGVALAKSFTLQTGKNIKVSNLTKPSAGTKTESIVVNSKGAAVYMLSGDRKGHLKCTSSMCLANWPLVTVSSAKAKLTAGSGVKGKLGTLKRGSKFQVTFNGHPLYTFAPDKKGKAQGNGIVAFGGTWHVFTVSTKKSTPAPPSNPNPPLPPGY